jgi:hypothetical protein
MKTIEDLSQKLAISDQWFATLWKSLKNIAKLLWTSEDNGKTWGDFILQIPERLQSFMKDGVLTCVKNVLAHIRVLAPSVSLEKLREYTDDDNYLDSIEKAEPKVEDRPPSLLESFIFSSVILMMKLMVRICSARALSFCKDVLCIVPYKEILFLLDSSLSFCLNRSSESF